MPPTVLVITVGRAPKPHGARTLHTLHTLLHAVTVYPRGGVSTTAAARKCRRLSTRAPLAVTVVSAVARAPQRSSSSGSRRSSGNPCWRRRCCSSSTTASRSTAVRRSTHRARGRAEAADRRDRSQCRQRDWQAVRWRVGVGRDNAVDGVCGTGVRGGVPGIGESRLTASQGPRMFVFRSHCTGSMHASGDRVGPIGQRAGAQRLAVDVES